MRGENDRNDEEEEESDGAVAREREGTAKLWTGETRRGGGGSILAARGLFLKQRSASRTTQY